MSNADDDEFEEFVRHTPLPKGLRRFIAAQFDKSYAAEWTVAAEFLDGLAEHDPRPGAASALRDAARQLKVYATTVTRRADEIIDNPGRGEN